MILVWGPSDDPPVERVLAVLRDRSVDIVHLDNPDLDALRYDVVLGSAAAGWLELHGRQMPLDQITAVYLRPTEDVEGRAAAEAARVLLAVISSLPGAVVNPPASGRSNWSKPYQLREIAAAGFHVPETLVTSDPSKAQAFLARHGRIVYKSISGVRSVVATLEGDEVERLEGVRTGPVQLQRWVDGLDVRVHVVADRWIATAVECEAPDYRYASQMGATVTMTEHEIPEEIGHRLVALTRSMGLLVAGADLRLTPESEWVCFEVNPSPGFSYYEDFTGQPIGAAIADLLVSGRRGG